MPMEGQWRRQETPLRSLTRRERFVALGVATLAVMATILLLIATAGDGKEPLAPGCIRATVPGLVGGYEVSPCGKQARYMCANHAGRHDPTSVAIEGSCRDAGVPLR
jgi:hypothetical protein